MGIFPSYIPYENVRPIGVEAQARHEAATRPRRWQWLASGLLHGSHTYVMPNADGQVQKLIPVSAGRRLSGVGPEHTPG